MPGIAVVGTDHAHVVELVQQLVAAGAAVRVVVATEDGIGPWLASQYPDARTEHPFEDDVDIVVSAAVPTERAALAVRAMRAGMDVVVDKPGVTSLDQLAEIRRVQAESGRRWLVVFGERLGTPAMVRAEKLVAAGRIGTVVHTVGLGPHTLALKHRPKWFYDPAQYGGILTDIGSHQVDQFLAFTGAPTASVVAATVRAHDEFPGVQVLGEMLLRAPDGRTGYARVDYFTPAGLGAWGDVRLTVVGTEGFLEVRSVDNSLVVVDGDRRESVDAGAQPLTWPGAFLGGAMPLTQEHVFSVHEVCLAAQARADQG